MSKGYKIILGVIGADCHVVGNRILDRTLSDHGIEVVNLGVMVSQQEFVEAAKAQCADAVLVSSIYGHGEIDCQGLREVCDEAGLNRMILYVGGNLVVGDREWSDVVELFSNMGYDRVFAPSVDLGHVIELLKSDIDLQREPMMGHNSRRAAQFDLAPV